MTSNLLNQLNANVPNDRMKEAIEVLDDKLGRIIMEKPEEFTRFQGEGGSFTAMVALIVERTTTEEVERAIEQFNNIVHEMRRGSQILKEAIPRIMFRLTQTIGMSLSSKNTPRNNEAKLGLLMNYLAALSYANVDKDKMYRAARFIVMHVKAQPRSTLFENLANSAVLRNIVRFILENHSIYAAVVWEEATRIPLIRSFHLGQPDATAINKIVADLKANRLTGFRAVGEGETKNRNVALNTLAVERVLADLIDDIISNGKTATGFSREVLRSLAILIGINAGTGGPYPYLLSHPRIAKVLSERIDEALDFTAEQLSSNYLEFLFEYRIFLIHTLDMEYQKTLYIRFIDKLIALEQHLLNMQELPSIDRFLAAANIYVPDEQQKLERLRRIWEEQGASVASPSGR